MESNTLESICSIVRRQETAYISGNTRLSKYVSFSLSETVNRIDAYLASKHITGETDSLGREKPFFNIVRAAANIWYRATDLDRKDIRIKALTARTILLAFVAESLLKKWMIRENFGAFLNDWGQALARYGSAVSEFVEKDGRLIPSVLAWNRTIIDSVDFDQNPVIKLLELTESELRLNTSYDTAQVDALINAYTTRKTKENLPKDTNPNYIKLYEIHGSFPLWHTTKKESDKKVYAQQIFVVAYLASENDKNAYDDYTLYAGKEKDPHMITHLIPEDVRSMAIGAVENLFESQWMTNHSVKAMKDQLDLAGKLLIQTADSNFENQNILTDIENGDILIHKPNMPLTVAPNNSHDLSSLQNFANMWRALGQEITSTPPIMSGGGLPSGTAWKLGGLLQQQANSNFEAMRQNKGLAIEAMMRRFIIPYIKKHMDNSDEIAAILDANDISQIDSAYIASEAVKRRNRKAIDSLVKGEVPEGLDLGAIQGEVQGELQLMGDHRFLKPSDVPDVTWKMLLKDFEWDCIVDVTGEYEDKDAILNTLTTAFQVIAQNPAVLQDQNARMIFNKILETTGVMSALELPSRPSAPVPSPIQPQQVQPAANNAGGGTAVGAGA